MRLQSSKRAQRPVRLVLLTACVLAALLISACGGSTSNGSSSATAGATAAANQAGVAEAQAFVTKYSARPTQIPVTQPVGKPIPTGKKIDFILCGVSSCQDLANAFTAGANALGWTVKQINTKGTPQTVQAAWQQAVRDKPDAVAASGFPRAIFSSQLAQLKAAGIPVVESATDDIPGNGILVIVDAPGDLAPEGEIMASWVTTDSAGKANTVYLDLPTYTILEPVRTYFTADYAKWCAGCKLDVLDIPITAIGVNVPTLVVSYLRAHPDVNHIAMSLGLLNDGLPAALRQAGLSGKVHTIVNVGDAVNYQYIASGQSQAAVAYNTFENAWTQVDTLARYFTGQSIQPDIAAKSRLPFMLITKNNLISTSSDFPLVADYQSQFKKLWGKS
jgi:ribose transport system substrate-binding protein